MSPSVLLAAQFELPLPVIVLGVIEGMTYGLLAVGLVLIYRSNRIVNFAHGEIGAFGASVLGLLVLRFDVPYWLAFVVVIALSAALGAGAEVAVVRRLRKAPSIMAIVATLGIAEFLILLGLSVNGQSRATQLFPQPPGLPQFRVGSLLVTPAYFGMLVLTPVLVVLLVAFLRYSRFGLAVRGAAANPESARMLGVSAGRMSTLSWAIAGAVAAFTAVLILPTRTFTMGATLGPALLLRALAPSVVARMNSLPVALGAGIGIGVVEQVLLWNSDGGGGTVEMVLFGIILVSLLAQRRAASRSEEHGAVWSAVQPWRPLPESLRQVWAIRNLGLFVGGAALLAALLLPVVVTPSVAIIIVAIMSYSLVGLSIGIITGLGGQLSLGQFGVAAIGAVASIQTILSTSNYFLSMAAAGLAGAAVSVAVGLPALRIKGLMLAVTTLSFALATQAWVLPKSWALGEGLDPGRPIIGSFALDTAKRYYFFALGFLVFGVLLARNVRRSGLARRLVAVRDNQDAARSFTVPAVAVKLQAFGLAGFLAGLGGAVYAHALSRVGPLTFPVEASISVVAMVALGGIGVLAGPLIGALYIIGVPRFLPLDAAGLAASSLGWLILILYFPGGISQLMRPLRTSIVKALARRVGVDAEAAWREGDGDLPADRALAALPTTITTSPRVQRPAAIGATGDVLLQVSGLTRRFGGLTAVDGVSLEVRRGETLGIIGPNGAGKTTLFELVGGFNTPDEGRVVYQGRDITGLGPETRARLGIVRSFQDAGLFPTMSVLECVMLAGERLAPTRFFPALAGLQGPERQKVERARELIGLMGLERYESKQVAELSTGTRRICELACVVALEPTLLLLDEPSSGIAQRESEALGNVLRRIKEFLDTSLVIIEHDMPLLMGLSDRVIAMESGRVIADGTPKQVQADPLVVESYLGGDPLALARSGAPIPRSTAPMPAADGRCLGVTRSGGRCSKRAGDDGYCHQHRDTALVEAAP